MNNKKRVFSEKKSKKGVCSTLKRPKISSRRPLNRYEKENPNVGKVSTSARKLSTTDHKDIKVEEGFGYRILNFLQVFSTISQSVVCKKCNSEITFTESGQRGLGFKIIISCQKCEKISIPSSPFIEKGYEINRRIVLSMRLLGVGLNGIIKFCAFMDLPRPIFQSFYDKIVHKIAIGAESVCQNSMKTAAQEEKKKSDEKGKTSGITVSGDGSWRKRGFSSLFGFVSLIGWYTGKVVDVLVKSKYCKSCEFWKKKADTEEYKEWFETHEENCQANHEGSAGKMEVDAVTEMFKRSESLHNLRYENYVGDGDSKTFKGIVDSQPYLHFIVKKKECIDHVQKRAGTRFRNIKKRTKGLGGRGKLTAKLIDELSIYYGLAIRRNHDSVEKMRNAIYATLDHKLSTDEKPKHKNCPRGEDSWCGWQKAQATGDLSYTHKPPLSQEVFKAISPIYKELTSDELLTRCIGGFTQNSNESFNAIVWSMAPKSTSSGKQVLDTAVYIAAGICNDGLTSILRLMQNLGIKIGSNCFNFCMKADERRINFSERSLADAAKKARVSLKSSRKEEEEASINMDGQMYGAGIAD